MGEYRQRRWRWALSQSLKRVRWDSSEAIAVSLLIIFVPAALGWYASGRLDYLEKSGYAFTATAIVAAILVAVNWSRAPAALDTERQIEVDRLKSELLVANPPIIPKTVFVRDISLSAGLPYGIAPKLTAFVLRPNAKLSFAVQYATKRGIWYAMSRRILLGSVFDVVRDQMIQIDLATIKEGKLYWENSEANYPIEPGLVRARIVVSDETGDEQYHMFLLASNTDEENFWAPYVLLTETDLCLDDWSEQ